MDNIMQLTVNKNFIIAEN